MNYDYLANQSFDVLTDAFFDALESGPAATFDDLTDNNFDALTDLEFDTLSVLPVLFPVICAIVQAQADAVVQSVVITSTFVDSWS